MFALIPNNNTAFSPASCRSLLPHSLFGSADQAPPVGAPRFPPRLPSPPTSAAPQGHPVLAPPRCSSPPPPAPRTDPGAACPGAERAGGRHPRPLKSPVGSGRSVRAGFRIFWGLGGASLGVAGGPALASGGKTSGSLPWHVEPGAPRHLRPPQKRHPPGSKGKERRQRETEAGRGGDRAKRQKRFPRRFSCA